MTAKDPFDPIFDEISSLIELARQKSHGEFSDELLSPEVAKRLDFLEDAIARMNEITDDQVKSQGLTNDELVNRTFDDRNLLPKFAKRAVEKSLNLSQDAFSLKFALQMAELQVKGQKSKQFESKKVEKAQADKRKAKFKKTQGNQSWKKI